VIQVALAPLSALIARIGPVIGGLEARHWVALAGSAALHLGVWLGFSNVPTEALPPPMTFEVKLEPLPAAKPVKLAKAPNKPVKAKTKKHLAKKPVKSKPREADTMLAEWKQEQKPARNAPSVNLPESSASGVQASATASAAGADAGLSAPRAGGAASGGQPGVSLASAGGGRASPSAPRMETAGGAQGSDTLAASAAASGHLASTTLSASAAAGGSLNRAASGGGQNVQASEFSSQSPGALYSGEPSGARLTLSGVLASLATLPAGSGSLSGGQSHGAAGASAASAGQGSQTHLATAASQGQPAQMSLAGPTRAGAGTETGMSEGASAAASGGATAAQLASAMPGPPRPNGLPGIGAAQDTDGGNPAAGAMAGAASASRAIKNALASQGTGDSAGQAPLPSKHQPGIGAEAGRPAVSSGKAGEGDRLARTGSAWGRSLDNTAQAAGAAEAAPGRAGAGSAGEAPRVQTGRALAGVGSTTPGQALAGGNAPPGGGEGGLGQAVARGLAGGVSGGGLAAASGGGSLAGRAGLGAGFSSSSGPSASLAPGEPGSAPRLAMAMAVVPAILDVRPGGARSQFRTGGEQGSSSHGAAPKAGAIFAGSGGETGVALPGRAENAPVAASPIRLASLGGGGASLPSGGKLQDVSVAPVRQMRPDSEVRPLDVLAPSTYCPLPGHAQPDNRPDSTQDRVEKPAYANENPSFQFPMRAWAYGHEGRVIVRVEVKADGAPGQMWIKQSSGSGILDVDAREQLANYRFKPARKNGQAVSAWIDVPVDYRLRAENKP
jgi:TonB family protein